jgi:hypothetical protein
MFSLPVDDGAVGVQVESKVTEAHRFVCSRVNRNQEVRLLLKHLGSLLLLIPASFGLLVTC